jgi:hypothetical protein
MATFGGPNTIETGLVLSLDAANTNSYTSGSTTWRDLSGNGFNSTLSNIIFNSNGWFDSGSATYSVNRFNSGSPQQGTYRIIMKFPPLDTTNATVLFDDGGSSNNLVYLYRNSFWATNTYGWLIYYTKTDTTIDALLAQPTYIPNVWYDIVFTFDTSGAYRVYRNAELLSSLTATSFSSWNRTGNNTPVLSANSGAGTGNLSSFQWYNRALTLTEIQQNYNAMRGRFGI